MPTTAQATRRMLAMTIYALGAMAALAACTPSDQPTADTGQKSEPSQQTQTAATITEDTSLNPGMNAPAGTYTLDKPHSSLIFRVRHMGFSNFKARFTRFDSTLQFDPQNPAASSVEVTIDPSSIQSDNPPPEFLQMLAGPEFLDAAKYPQMKFKSTRVDMDPSGGGALTIYGDLTLHGVTKPVVLTGNVNGGYPGMAYDPHARIGFSVQGGFMRSDFGITNGIPAPGSFMGVSDEVVVDIETEFSGPDWKPETK